MIWRLGKCGLAVVATIALWPVAAAGAATQERGTEPASANLSRVVSRYIEQTRGGLSAVLDYKGVKLTDDPAFGATRQQPLQLPASIVFRFGLPGHPSEPERSLPPFDEQGLILNHLLGRLIAEHPDLPSHLRVLLGDSREGLIEELDRKLVDPGTDWDAKLGLPRHLTYKNDSERFVKLCAFLAGTIDQVLQSSPLATAFNAHGYTLHVTNISPIGALPMIAPRKDMGGRRLPYDFEMDIVATRAPDKG